VQIITFYPGMPPDVMERDIMSRLERWTGQSVGIEHQEAKAMLGVCIVKDFFREGISFDTAMSQVTSYAMSDLFYLPPGTIPPMVMPFDPTASVPLCLVSVSSPTMSEKELYDVAYYELRNRLQSIQGVIAPAVYGGTLRRIMAYVEREKLEARGLAPTDVVHALDEQSVLIPAGNMKVGAFDYQIFANAMPPKVEQLNDIPINIVDGAPVFLKDVGEARDSHQIQSNIVRINGRRQAYIPIYRQPGANTIEIVDAIRTQLRGILDRLRLFDPRAKDMALEVVLDQSVYVRKSIEGLEWAGLLGAFFAALVVFVFLKNWRSTLIICMAIPFSILAAIVGLFYTGDTLNAMTLGGLALAIGILVDQSIVILENIVRHVEMGKTPLEAALDGTQEVIRPIFVSTLTFIIVFYPIVFLSGMAKFLFQPLAVAATFAILASFLLSITLIPAYCAYFLKFKAHRGDDPATGSHGRGETALIRQYGKWMARALDRRRGVLAASLVLFLSSLLLFTRLGTELFPPVDAGQFQVFVRLPSGTRIENTEEVIRSAEQVITETLGEADPEYPAVEKHADSNLKILISNIGVLMDWPAAYTPNTGPMDAFILVQLKGKRGMPGAFDAVTKLRERLREKFPDVEFSFDTGGMLTAALNMGEPAPIHLQVSGGSADQTPSFRIASLIGDEMRRVGGTADVRVAQRIDYPTVKMEIDRVKAAQAGVNVRDIMQNLVTATNSSVNFKPAFWIDEKNGNHYFIGAQYREEDMLSFETLRDIPVAGKNSARPVPMRNLTTMTRGVGPAVINHHNITRVMDVYANVLPGYDVGTVVKNIEKRLAASAELAPKENKTPRGVEFDITGPAAPAKGYRYNLAGEAHVMRESFRQFSGGLVIAILLVYLIMVAEFRSFVEPFVILMSVPLGFIGVVAMLYATGTTFNIQSMMGVIMMVGIVVEYSIVLMDFANQRVAAGLPVRAAMEEAARARLHPILMTSLTTLLALIPMAVGFGGGDANIPLARAIVGGVLGATVLSLFVVPCLYVSIKKSSAPQEGVPS
jgi:multidrug efflux pump subunit AcrB